MHVPNAADIVTAWERALGESPVQRALTLLAMAYPGQPRVDLAVLPVAERDRRLLALHECLFGSWLHSCADCPRCGTPLEFSVDARQLRPDHELPTAALECSAGELRIQFRLPTSEDLESLFDAPSVTEARRRLAQRCVVAMSRDERQVEIGHMSDAVVDRIATAMTTLDGQPGAVVTVQCAQCRHAWDLAIDMGSFLWGEVNALARRLLRQVHTLAWAYGWSEGDVLQMTSVRRDFYLQMVLG